MLRYQENIEVEDELKRVRVLKTRNEMKSAQTSKIFQIRRNQKEAKQWQIRKLNSVLQLNTNEQAKRLELEKVEIEMLCKLKNTVAEQQRALQELNSVKRPLPGEEVK